MSRRYNKEYVLVKEKQLGMNPGTASAKLIKDILFDTICKTGVNKCFRCNLIMTREDFSIDHKVPWLHDKNAKELFFNLSNIGYSHKKCNVSCARRPYKKNFSDEDRRLHKNKLQRISWSKLGKERQQEIRRKKYERNGK